MKPDQCAHCGQGFLPEQRFHMVLEGEGEGDTFHEACWHARQGKGVFVTEADVRRAVGELLEVYGERLISPRNVTEYRIVIHQESLTARLCDLLGLTTDRTIAAERAKGET